MYDDKTEKYIAEFGGLLPSIPKDIGAVAEAAWETLRVREGLPPNTYGPNQLKMHVIFEYECDCLYLADKGWLLRVCDKHRLPGYIYPTDTVPIKIVNPPDWLNDMADE